MTHDEHLARRAGEISWTTPDGLADATWRFMQRPMNIVRMETAAFLARAGVEALDPALWQDTVPRSDRAR